MSEPRKIKGYENGFDYGAQCARTMSSERCADNARYVKASEYYQPMSPTCEYWRGFVSALESSLV